MPVRYKYRAVSRDGQVHKGVVTSQSSELVEQLLSNQNLLPIKITPVGENKTISMFGFLRRVDYDKLISFTTSLATLHRAGVPLLRALSIIKVGKENSRFNYAIDQIKLNVRSGKPLSEGMAEFSDLFSRTYTASVAAGEESGKLEYTLDELAEILEKEMEMNRQIRLAIRYPLIVITVIIAAFVVMMTFVIPRFVDFYSSFGAQIPAPTRLMIFISNTVSQYWPLVLAGLVAAGLTFKKIISNKNGRFWFDRQLLKLPIFGNLIIKSNIARFALMFKILFRSGLPIIKCLDILASTIKNTVIEREIRQLEELFKKGKDIEIRPGNFKYLPDMSLHMMSIGLESGSLDEMLGEIGKHYTKEVAYTSRQLISVIEPILTLVLGVFILLLALAIFLPMWNLIKVFNS
ncbi:MAG: type II secretion system F family protein [candidate division Zixibacteria bacterium]|nr:type II secretion system F family protein [candidate division Zixibacteria bacterium]